MGGSFSLCGSCSVDVHQLQNNIDMFEKEITRLDKEITRIRQRLHQIADISNTNLLDLSLKISELKTDMTGIAISLEFIKKHLQSN
jgi:hypothetical protein